MKSLAVLALSAIVSPGVWARPADGVEKFLIETAPGQTRWVTEAEKWKLKEQDVNFFDITDSPEDDFTVAAEQIVAQFPSQLRYAAEVKPLFSKLSAATMRRDLEKFSSFHNRYYRAQTGVQSAEWLFDQVSDIVRRSGARGATVQKIKHSFIQPSIVATIPGKSRNTIVVGAHQDSINGRQPSGRAPGADDDGSGSVTILDSLRVLLSSPKIARGEGENTIEFHWYAGEEAGLLGSQDIFRQYRAARKPVKAMLNQDMTGYTRGRESAGLPEAFGVVTDFTTPALTAFTRLVIREYTDIAFVDDTCGYACSDHASASRNGFPSAYVHESDGRHDNPYIHTTEDTIEKLNFNHMVKHGQMIVGWLYELAFARL
ncbi:hypothetical protein UREG_05217 [Uncinocarpus reesii 1704]|uniref:Peptide hydrolase n=1 Tax=Uncinocarpus reesii (strain UAMH 1704) TaxID=336963 RepID=C4JRX8_UNCRE|nr:uncharacterized protein UREG_05217 [Uncinocarpus reesii 1704]EEP80375.1 hypothetical protein UREG_05217 [Uncinocarpus reesii 1704]